MAYDVPTAATLKLRYPAFASVDDAVIEYWITDAQRYVTTAWSDTDYAVALMALAAHNMTLAGLGADAAAVASIPSGITAMKSGSLALNFTPEAANARLNGTYGATRYGTEYELLLRRNRGGPYVQDTGAVMGVDFDIRDGFRYPQGEF
jgi:hypothetical protein